MASSRAYVPSQLLLRSFLHPLPRQCSLSRRLHLPSRSTTAPAKTSKKPNRPVSQVPVSFGPEPSGLPYNPNPEKLNEAGVTAIEWWEQDEQGNQRFIDAIASKEDVRKHKEYHKRLEKWAAGEDDGNDAEFRNMTIEELKRDPNFSDMREELEDMKKPVAEIAKELDEVDEILEAEEMQDEQQHFQHMLEFLKGLEKDRELAHCRELIGEIRAKLPEWGTLDHAEFLKAMGQLNEASGGEPAEGFQNKLLAYARGDPDPITKAPGKETDEFDFDKDLAELKELQSQLKDMQALFQGRDMNPEVQAELERMNDIIGEDDSIFDVEDEDGDVDIDKLKRAVAKLDEQELAEAQREAREIEEHDYLSEEEKADPALKAKVDKIMADPRLMEKIKLMRALMDGTRSYIVNAKHAPDPESLPPSELATLQEQLEFAQSDPEHSEALKHLRVNLLPPYNAHPHLRPFNEALRFAYVGANDDIRRVLWRAYLKARSIPGLVQAIPDDTWDLLWYSQAVDWRSNQNRLNHLKLLMADLASVGRHGPPTKMAQGEFKQIAENAEAL